MTVQEVLDILSRMPRDAEVVNEIMENGFGTPFRQHP